MQLASIEENMEFFSIERNLESNFPAFFEQRFEAENYIKFLRYLVKYPSLTPRNFRSRVEGCTQPESRDIARDLLTGDYMEIEGNMASLDNKTFVSTHKAEWSLTQLTIPLLGELDCEILGVLSTDKTWSLMELVNHFETYMLQIIVVRRIHELMRDEYVSFEGKYGENAVWLTPKSQEVVHGGT